MHVCRSEEDVEEVRSINGDGHGLNNARLASENAHLGDDAFPPKTYRCKYF